MRRILEACAEIEEVIAAVYRHWAATQEGTGDIGDFWRRMSRDEEQHAQQLRLASRLATTDEIAGAKLTREEVEELLEQARRALERVRSRSLAVDEALALARTLEEDFQKVHVRFALRFGEGDLKRLFDQLAREDRRHASALAEFDLRAS